MIEISQPSFRGLEALRLIPGKDALLDVTSDEEDGPVAFVIRYAYDGNERPFTRTRADVLRDLGVTGARLARARFENDFVHWGLIPL
jgi:hypothetical protein